MNVCVNPQGPVIDFSDAAAINTVPIWGGGSYTTIRQTALSALGLIEPDFAPCDLDYCFHAISDVYTQLNVCHFYHELFDMGEVDCDWLYIFGGVRHGFKIVDEGTATSYNCSNYSSILQPKVRAQMTELVKSEIQQGKIMVVEERPQCVHSLGAVFKKSGSLRPITDCSRPYEKSINNFMDTTRSTFSYIRISDVTAKMTRDCYMSVVDIKSAYRSVPIYPAHRKFQGFQ
jgi:hypothetical protein